MESIRIMNLEAIQSFAHLNLEGYSTTPRRRHAV